jgi:PTS system nitrogen regulatory IIA component
MSELMTLPEVAQFLKIADRTVYLWAQKGKLPGFKMGTVWRFKREDIDRWIDVQKQQTKTRTGDK